MGVDTMKNFQTIFLIAVALFFVLIFGFLLLTGTSKTDAAKHIRAIGYPRDTVMVNQRPYLIVEMHDCVNDTVVYFDTIPLNIRTPSTLEDFDPKWRSYRLRN